MSSIIGEETGGGAYGNSAWMLPDVTLPLTGLRFSLPKFRLVMDKDQVAAGRGVMPDIEVLPSVESIRKGVDPKVEVIKEIILSKNGAVARGFYNIQMRNSISFMRDFCELNQ